MILNGPNTVEAYLRDLLADPASARPRQVLRSFTRAGARLENLSGAYCQILQVDFSRFTLTVGSSF